MAAAASELRGDGELVVVEQREPVTEHQRGTRVREGATGEVRQPATLLVVVTFQRADHATVRHDEDRRALIRRFETIQGAPDALDDRSVGLPTRRAAGCFEIARPRRFDLVAR